MKKILSLLLTALILSVAAADKATRVIALGGLKYNDIEKSCKTILSQDGEILYFQNNNAILVEDTANNIKRIEIFIKHAQDELKKTAEEPKTQTAPAKVPNYKIIPLGNVEFGTVDSNCRSWLSPDGKMVYSVTNNAVIVTDTPKVIAAVEKFIADLAKTTPEPVYDKIQYSNPGSDDSNTVIIYSGWLNNGWVYPRRYRPWGPPGPPPRPRPPGPHPPRPPHPPVPIPVPRPEPSPRHAPNLRPGDIQRRPDGAPSSRPDSGPRGGGHSRGGGRR